MYGSDFRSRRDSLIARQGAHYGVRKDEPVPLLVRGGLALMAGWIAVDKWSPLEFVLFPVGGLVAVLGLTIFLRRLARWPHARVILWGRARQNPS